MGILGCTEGGATADRDAATANEPASARDGGALSELDAETTPSPSADAGPALTDASADASTIDAGSSNGASDGAVIPAGDGGPTVVPGDAVFSEDFEDEPLTEPWLGRDFTEVVDCGAQGRCMRVAYEPDDRGSPRITRDVPLPPGTEYTLSYRLLFEQGFEFVKGGKLPGLGPKNPTTGCDDTTPDGWSSRLMWRREGRAVIYLYHQERVERCGDDVEGDGKFAIGTWHDLALHVRVNTPGEHDGFAELFLNGASVSRHEGILFRGTRGEATEIGSLMFHTFFGGSDSSWSPSKPVFARYDDFVVVPGAPRKLIDLAGRRKGR